MHSLDIDALTDDREPRTGAVVMHAQQYAVRSGDTVTIYGDQRWVMDGEAAIDEEGVTIVRDVTVTYGLWRVLGETHPHPATLAESHIAHYRSCGCLDGAAECCRTDCPCRRAGETDGGEGRG